MKRKKFLIYLIWIFIIGLLINTLATIKKIPIEDVEIITALGYDIDKISENEIQYRFPFEAYVFSPDGSKSSIVKEGRGLTPGKVLEDRQKYLDKFYIRGMEIIFVVGEKYAAYGIKPLIEDKSRNHATNDMAYGMVYDGNVKELLSAKKEGYSNISEYLYSLIKNSEGNNFFSHNYKGIDVYTRAGYEGRRIALPYIEKKKEDMEITGIAIFEKDKMVTKLDMKDTKIFNMLREDKVKGIVSIKNSTKEYVDFHALSKRKVKCNKKGDKYDFTIYLDLKGDLIDNTMYKDLDKNLDIQKKVEKEFEKEIEKSCKEFISKMQNQYKLDLIDLGRVAAYKYGRRTGVDWNKVIANSNIDVKVKVSIVDQGRGDY